MDDPIERVARALAESREFVWDALSDRPKWGHVTNKAAFIDQAETLCNWFTKQGIPIDKLLSGVMVAIALWPGQTMADVEGAIIDSYQGTISSEEWRELQKQAQLDYAGNPPVTPERAQEPTGATDSEKRPLRGASHTYE